MPQKTLGSLVLTTVTRVEKYTSEAARQRGDTPEIVERSNTRELSEQEALALGFTHEQIEEARNGTHSESDGVGGRSPHR